MRKFLFFALFSLLASIMASPSANASKIHISFVMTNPITHTNLGAGHRISLSLVNRGQNLDATTDSNGVASFNIDPLDYVLSSQVNSCCGDFPSSQGTQYLISPQQDGSVKVFSAADEVMAQDSAGNWIISIILKRILTGEDPWQIMKNNPKSDGSPEHMYLMTNGKVLVQTRGAQGFEQWWLLTPDSKGSYLNGTWSRAAQPPASYNPQNVNAAVLHSGNFLIVGGEQNVNSSGIMEENSNQSYLYDVVKDSWTFVTPPNNGEGDWTGIGAAPFAELADGRIMVGWNGGRNTAGLYAMLFDPVTSTWTATGTNKRTSNGEQGYTLLSNDKLLNIWNGNDSPELVGYAEIFDPKSGLWTPAARIGYDLGHSEIGPALTLPNGKVLAMGATGRNALYDPILDSWTSVPDFPKLKNGLHPVAADNPAAVLPNGNVLVQTSVFTCSTQNCYWMGPALWYEYDINSNVWVSVPDDKAVPAASHLANGTNMLVLPNGQVMVTTNGALELYTSKGSPNSSWLPKIETVSSLELTPDKSYLITGKQLSGLTQGTFWGDEQQNSTNYGLVQITNKASNHVFFARSMDFSNTSIAPNADSTLSFIFNRDVENGPSSLRVIASGVASAPMDVMITGGYDKVAADKVVSDKAASELKAKQELEAKAAAELKAKQDAEAKATADKATADKAIAPKKITITCVKGKNTKKVTSLKPVCPIGYKKK